MNAPSTAPGRLRQPRPSAAIGWLALGLAALTAPVQTQAQEAGYPHRPVRMVVSYAAGNVTDTLARIVADQLSQQWGQPVTVDNKPGQGGSLGAQIAMKAPADGYTLLFSAMAAMAINPHVYPNVGYDPRKDFAPIVNVAYPNMVLVVTPGLKIKSLPQLVHYGNAHPTALNYGTAGNGTVPHLNMEALKARTGLKAQHVPYKAAAAVLTDLIGGRVQIQQEASSVLLPQIKAGKVVPLAVGSPQRHPQLPDVPTLGELYPRFEPVTPWLALFAPAHTPAPVIDKINQDVRTALAKPAVQKLLAEQGLSAAAPGAPKALGEQLQRDYDRLGALVREMNLKVD